MPPPAAAAAALLRAPVTLQRLAPTADEQAAAVKRAALRAASRASSAPSTSIRGA
jgi:hypothetical protein